MKSRDTLLRFPLAFAPIALVLAAFSEPPPSTGDGPATPSAPQATGPLLRHELVQLLGDDTEAADTFGISVALSGDTAVVGARWDDDGGMDAGSAYVFARGARGWTQQAKLTASDPEVDAQFGSSVAISGETILVGAPRVGSLDAGAVYLFERDGTSWNEVGRLTNPHPQSNDFFGSSVALAVDLGVVGVPLDDDVIGFQSGSAYLLRRTGSNWSVLQDAKLQASDGQGGDQFGISVSVSGGTVLVGAYGEDEEGDAAGAAYVFEKSGATFVEQAKLTASDPVAFQLFGQAVSLCRDTALIGAPGDPERGAAYVFTRQGASWSEQAKLVGRGLAVGAFGFSVSVSGDTALVGAPYDDTVAIHAGAVYVFDRNGTRWTARTRLAASDAAVDDEFGCAAAISEGTTVVGAWLSDAAASQGGAAYLFELSKGPKVRFTGGPPTPRDGRAVL